MFVWWCQVWVCYKSVCPNIARRTCCTSLSEVGGKDSFSSVLTEEPIPYIICCYSNFHHRHYNAGKWMSRNATWSERRSVMYCQALPNGTDVSNSLLELLGLSFYLYQTESLWCHIQSGHEMRVRKSKHLGLGSELPYACGCISGCLSHLFQPKVVCIPDHGSVMYIAQQHQCQEIG